jgi:hypothetical protein
MVVLGGGGAVSYERGTPAGGDFTLAGGGDLLIAHILQVRAPTFDLAAGSPGQVITHKLIMVHKYE